MKKALHNISFVTFLSLGTGFLVAIISTLYLFTGAQEAVITGSTLLSFALGWAMLAKLSTRNTEQPQKWAYIPAVYMAVVGFGLLVLRPGDGAMRILSWIWPPIILGLVGWLFIKSHKQLKSWTKPVLLYPVFVVLALMAIGALYENVLEARHAVPSSGRTYSVNGKELYLNCIGNGSPTVVLISGYGENSPSWAWIQQAESRNTRVCAYDRPGEGWSQNDERQYTGVQQMAELHDLLKVAKVPGPYVLTGHSIGGTYAMIYAQKYPRQTAGVVLLDSSVPDQFKFSWYPGVYSMYKTASTLFPSLARIGVARITFGTEFTGLPPQADQDQRNFSSTARQLGNQTKEWAELRQTFADAKQLQSLSGKPLYILTAGKGQMPGGFEAQRKLTKLSSNSVQSTAGNAVHTALLEDEVVSSVSSKAIDAVVQSARSGQPLGK